MKKLPLMILFAFLIISGKQMFGQTATNIDSLLCQVWKPLFYEDNGEKTPVESAQKNDRMIFTLDHKFQIKQTGTVETGDWKYDPVTKQLIIIESKDGDSVPMNVVTLTKKELVLELLDPDAGFTRIYLVSAPQ